ncbi:MAG: DJ-1/PfpI family protein [Candidatus Pacebacteria bacterium]|nr:DJ-1/PfpI family protein [Candidatus Paceibacterota bacterium]
MKALLIIANKNFRDEEYFIPKQILEKNGIETKTASNEKGIAVGTFGGEASPDLSLEEVNANNFDAIIFVGGSGAKTYLDNEISYDIARQAIQKNKILAAICIAPTILAKAGVLNKKKCTVWSSNMDKSAIKTIKENGGEYTGKSVITDKNIITGENADFAEEFGQAILKVLTD